MTPYQMLYGSQPDYSNLRVWGSQAFIIDPAEVRPKGGPMRYEGIFVRYEENRLGWGCVDLNGKYRFTNDAIFNESAKGRLGRKRRALPEAAPLPATDSPPVPSSSQPPRRSERLQKQSQLHDQMQMKRDKLLQLQVPTDSEPPPTLPSAEFLADYATLAFVESLVADAPFLSLEDLEDHCILSAPVEVAFSALSYTTSQPSLHKPPASYKLALDRSDWMNWEAAMQREVKSLEEKGVFERVPSLPHGRRAIPLMWVYDFKHGPAGEILSEKARVVILGNRQGVHEVGETYSAVAKSSSIRLILAYASTHHWYLNTFDVKTAFLNADLTEEVYCRQVPHFPEPDKNTVLRLRKALYGPRQAGNAWYHTLKPVLEKFGLQRCEIDHGVFFGSWLTSPHPSVPMPSDGSPLRMLLPIHVDDGCSATNSLPLYNYFIVFLNQHFTVNDLGPLRLFLGISFEYDRERGMLSMSQQPFIEELLASHNLINAKSQDVPLKTKSPNNTVVPPNALPRITDSNLTKAYQSIVGSLLYVASWTRPDIAYAVVSLAQWNSTPTRSTLLAAKGVLRYLLGTRHHRLSYGDGVRTDSVGYCDADWAMHQDDRRSISGYAFFLHSGLVSWSSSKQKATALSSTEAEYMAITHATKELLWLRMFSSIVDIPFPRPFRLLSDNNSAIDMTKSNIISNRAKHIDLRYHFIRDHVAEGTLRLNWISTKDMTADIFTKPLPYPLHSKHSTSLGINPTPQY